MASPGTKFFFLLFLCSLLSKAQGVKVPFNPILFEDGYGLYNSSQSSAVEGVQAGIQNRIGAFSEIREFYGFGNLSIGEKRNFGVGLIFYSEQEGELISENRLKATFWKKVAFSKTTNMVASGQLGFINTSLGATNSTSGANTWAPDIDFGLTFNLENTSIAASVNQIGSPETSPLSQEVYFRNFFTVFVSHKIDLSPYLVMKFYANSYFYNTIPDLYFFKTNLEYNETFNGGIGFGTSGLLFSVGLNTKKFMSENIGIKFAYQNPSYSKLPSTYQMFQVHLAYTFER